MQIRPGLHSLGNTSGGRVRAYLIDDGNGLTLIDTLLNKDGRDILEEIRRLGRQPNDLKRIILTRLWREPMPTRSGRSTFEQIPH